MRRVAVLGMLCLVLSAFSVSCTKNPKTYEKNTDVISDTNAHTKTETEAEIETEPETGTGVSYGGVDPDDRYHELIPIG